MTTNHLSIPNNRTAYAPSPLWRILSTSIIALSCLFTVAPMLLSTIRGLSKEHLLIDTYIVIRTLAIASGFTTIHFAAYKGFVFRKYKHAILFLITGYILITLGVSFGWLVFNQN